ncbi:MAG: SemiSWEET family sugar transporter [Beijerinckiaceae bacterium]
MNPTFVESVGTVAAVLTTTAFLPQAVRTIRSRQTRDISLWTQAMLFVGNNLWLFYGVLLGSWPLIIGNVVGFFLVGTILVMKIRHG